VTAAPARIDAPFTLGAQIEARARHADIAERAFVKCEDLTWTYRQYRDECVRYAHFLMGRLGTRGSGDVAILLENHPEMLALYGACGYAGLTLFGVNTGQRGETLAGVLNQSKARILVVEDRLLHQVEAVAGSLEWLGEENILVLPTREQLSVDRGRILQECIGREVGDSGESLEAPEVEVAPDTNLMVIYTSGTTGLPKGINNNHFKLLAIGLNVAARLELTPDDCGYACMPLFHSNSMFLGFHPAFHAGASLALRERFSASSFVPDVKRYGVTYWNYVGEPVHYILGAIEREYGSDEERIRREVTEDPRNRFRYALGNGASPPDIDRFMRWMGLEDMYELYGSTEAAISTFRTKHDPRGSVGEITDLAVRILDENGFECPLAMLDAEGKIANYSEAVGEICRVAPDMSLFQGYFENRDANEAKYRDGVYHSGDLGHVIELEGRRYLYFDGRTDDWIRKDGENFSAAQVARHLTEYPDVVLAVAYGAPCAVSDELVMAALKLREGASFDPQEFFGFCEKQVVAGGMDRKWLPDFVRVVDEFTYTQTQKVLVRYLKQEHFDLRRIPEGSIYWRRRGDKSFRLFTLGDFEALREEFEAAERSGLLDR
jgi:fatty-acyl-CoA synthase